MKSPLCFVAFDFLILFLPFKGQLKTCLLWESFLIGAVHVNLLHLWILTVLPACLKK